MRLAAIEGGGTRFRCGIGDEHGRLQETWDVATADPGTTLDGVVAALRGRGAEALGIACFGPLGLDPGRADYGRLLHTPKPGWAWVDVAGHLGAALGVPVGLDTDVNGAAIGEAWLGAARGVSDVLYVTVGTGVGFGLLSGGRPVHGRMHPEGGHLPVRRLPGDTFAGICEFHGDCLEGLVSGPALAARCGGDPAALGPDDPVWEPVVAALAEGIASAALLLAPGRIILGGGVGRRLHLLGPLRAALAQRLAGYLPLERFGPLDSWIQGPGLGPDAGLVGALALARDAAREALGESSGGAGFEA